MRVFSSLLGLVVAGSGVTGLATPAAAGPAGTGEDQSGGAAATPVAGTATSWEEPAAGTSAEIRFPDAPTAATRTALSPHLAEIVDTADRARTVDIDAAGLTTSLAAESVSIELFEDADVALTTAVAPSRGATVDGRSSYVYSGDGDDSTAILTIIDGDVHGALWQEGTRYGIEPLDGGRHLVFEEGRSFPPEGEPVGHGDTAGPSPAVPATTDPTAPAGPAVADPVVVDVMVAFDDNALADYGSVTAAEDEIAEMINLSNMIFNNSQLDVQLALTDAYELNYTPNAADGTDDDLGYIEAIRDKSDGIVDNLHTVRDTDNADLVAVLSDMNSACGLGYLPTSSDPAEFDAYTLTDTGCAVDNLSFPHEVGHNLCAHHDPDNVDTNQCASDAYGHFSSADSLRTVMAYPNPCGSCTRIPYFSNPDVTYNSWTTGILGSRDNSRVIAEYAPDVAAYRSSGPTPTACEVTYTITNTWSGNVQVDLTVENTTASTINSWTAAWTFTGDENVYNSWGVNISQTGADATATGDGYGASIPANDSVTVGFQATVTGTPTVPAPISCTV